MYAARWGRMAVLYFAIGSLIGLVIGIIGQFQFAPVHAHINLIGWVSMGLIAVLYKVFPSVESSGLNPAAFWLYQLAFPTFMISMYLTIQGNSLGTALTPVGGTLTFLAIALNVFNLFMHIKPAEAAAAKAKAS